MSHCHSDRNRASLLLVRSTSDDNLSAATHELDESGGRSTIRRLESPFSCELPGKLGEARRP
jgi:hypothetical protein